MTIRFKVCLTVLICLTGCKNLELGSEWRPLTEIRQSKLMTPGLSVRGARTVGSSVYVRDLERWLEENPEPRYTAILKHERVHAERQKKIGLTEFLGKYLTDVKFMWEEEKLGWYAQLVHYQQTGYRFSHEALARSLHNYQNAEGHMVSEKEALAWIRDVLAGRWKPSK